MVDEKFQRLRRCLSEHDEKDVQDALFDLSAVSNDWIRIPDEVAERLLTLLENEEMYKSRLAAHLLNFFQLESKSLKERGNWLCIGFFNAHSCECQAWY